MILTKPMLGHGLPQSLVITNMPYAFCMYKPENDICKKHSSSAVSQQLQITISKIERLIELYSCGVEKRHELMVKVLEKVLAMLHEKENGRLAMLSAGGIKQKDFLARLDNLAKENDLDKLNRYDVKGSALLPNDPIFSDAVALVLCCLRVPTGNLTKSITLSLSPGILSFIGRVDGPLSDAVESINALKMGFSVRLNGSKSDYHTQCGRMVVFEFNNILP